MYVGPASSGAAPQMTRRLAEVIAGNWWVLLLDGLALIVAGILIFSIDWSVRSLSIFIGALFILHGLSTALWRGLDMPARRTNALAGLLSIAAGIAIMVWPSPGLTVVAVFLGAWLIVMGTLSIGGGFAARDLLKDWWLWALLGVFEVALGVLALADPGATLAALITVGGIWAVVIGVMYVVIAFQVRQLPDKVERWMAAPDAAERRADMRRDVGGADYSSSASASSSPTRAAGGS
jgi:uncharacterized membrane protein HdeD (DUF308 family)